MATQSQDIKINIKANTTKATNQIKKLNSQIKQLEKENQRANKSLKTTNGAINKVGASFKQLSAHLARLVVIYGSFNALISTVKIYANFEQAIKTLGAVSGATGDELVKLEDKAKELGETTVFSATQVAEAMIEMARAGLTAQEQLDAIDGVLNLSINGMVTLAEASKIATTAMNGFGLEASDISNISDVLSKATNSYATTLSELGLAMTKVAPVAKSMGVSFEETTALLGLLADAGRRGAEAGTQLKITMLRLGANVEARKWIKDIGVDMYNNNGTLKSFTNQLRAVEAGMVGLTQKQQLLAKARIFGSEALASAEILLANLEKIDPAIKELENSFGYAQDNATKMMNTLQGSYKELVSALESLQIQIGKNLAPALRGLIEDSTEFIRSLDEEQIRSFTDDLASMATTLGSVYDGFKKLLDMGHSIGKSLNSVVSVEFLATTLILYRFRKAILAISVSLGLIKPALGFLTTSLVRLVPALGGVVSIFASLGVTLSFVSAILMGIPVILGGVGYAYYKLQNYIEATDKETENFTKSSKKLNKVIEDTYTKLDKLSKKEIEKSLMELSSGAKQAEKQLKAMGEELQELENKQANNNFLGFNLGISEWETERIAQLKKNIDSLATTLNVGINHTSKTLKKAGQELVNARQEGLRLNALEKNSRYALTKDAIALEEEQLKAVKKTTQGYETRLKTLESTLVSMQKSEKGLVNDLKKLEQELADARERHSTERLSQSHKFKNNLANIEANNLNELDKYNNAQLRADEELAKSKQALDEGNLKMAEEYHSEYMRLISVNAMSEIKIGDDVQRSKQENINELLADTRDGNKVATQLLLEKQRIEEDGIKKKIALKFNELELFRVQMRLQVKLISMMGKLAGFSKGLVFDEQLKQFNAEALKAEATIDRLVSEQKAIIMDIDDSKLTGKISDINLKMTQLNNFKVDTTDAVKEVDDVGIALDKVDASLSKEQSIKVKADKAELVKLNDELNKMIATDKDLVIGTDDTQAQHNFNELQRKIEELKADIETPMTVDVDSDTAIEVYENLIEIFDDMSEVDIEVDADTNPAVQKLNKLSSEGDALVIEPSVELDVSDAINTMNRMLKEFGKPIYKKVVITTVHRGSSQRRQDGGVILPRFADGGHLDNGIGHTRKTDSLSGYGGGDRIKALLEAGEFIIKKESVRKLGLDRLNMINQGKLPRFQDGGGVKLPRYNTGGSISESQSSSSVVELNLNLGGETFKMMTDVEVASALERYTRANL